MVTTLTLRWEGWDTVVSHRLSACFHSEEWEEESRWRGKWRRDLKCLWLVSFISHSLSFVLHLQSPPAVTNVHWFGFWQCNRRVHGCSVMRRHVCLCVCVHRSLKLHLGAFVSFLLLMIFFLVPDISACDHW